MKQVFFRVPQRAFMLIFGLLLSLGAFAQITVNGHVKDATGEGVIGATVRIVGQEGGTVTDFDGNFMLKCKEGVDLQISSVGYQTVTVKAAPEVNVVLKDDAALLNEVVVIGYGVAKKNDLTGSVTAIKPDEKNRALVTSAQDMMQGKIAGVNVTTGSGQPGTGATIRIRGGSSLNASNDPLIVIDGLAMDNQGVKGLSNPLSMVNPNDIESFTVLKDASATAIYGSRGSNGVIIITTKKGRKGAAPTVSYSGNVSIATVKKYVDVLNGEEYKDLVAKHYGTESAQYGLLGYTDENGNKQYANTDWQKEIYRSALSTDHSVTVSGGLKNMPYRVSVGYTDQNGILKTSNYQRFTSSVNVNPSFLDDHLKFNVNGKFMYAYNKYANTAAIGNAVSFDPTKPVTLSNKNYDNFNHYYQWTESANYGDSAWPLSKIALAGANPVSNLNELDNKANSYDYQGNVEIDYTVHGFEDLHLHMNLSGDWAHGVQDEVYQPWGPSNFYYGSYNLGNTENKYNLIYSAYAQYLKDFNEAHHFDIMGGYEWKHEKYWGHYNSYGLYPSTSSSYNEDPEHKYNKQGSEWKSEHYLVSFYGRMNYSLLDRYMLTATVRADGSSRFGKGHKWGVFPSVALGWKLKEEKFLKDVTWLDDLKLRLGYGQTGQQEGIGDYAYFATYSTPTNSSAYYPAVGNGVQSIPDGYNPDLTWETTTTYNVGIDFAFIKNRLTGSVDVYKRKTTDLLMSAPVAAMSNFASTVMKNIGSLENTGVELALTVRPVQTKDWQWEITTNATYNKNKITELAGDGQPIQCGDVGLGTGSRGMAQQVGYPMNSFWVYQQVYDENGKPLQGVVVDQNADGVISDADRIYYKQAAAPWLFGLSTRVQYKNWDLGTSFRLSLDNYVFNRNKLGYRSVDFIGSGTGYMNNTMPYSTLVGFSESAFTYDALTDYFVENASFLKCDNITLGYSFENFLKGAKYKGLSGRVYMTASNVFTVTNYDGLDPEVDGGIDGSIYPRPFSLLLGLSLNF